MDSPIPALDGSLSTLPEIADYIAEHEYGDRPWLVFPDRDAPHKIVELSFREVARASQRVAHIVRPAREGPEREVVAMLIHIDTVLYVAALLGLLRAGFVPYPMSPRNTVQGIVHIMETVSCMRVLGDAATSSLIQDVRSELALKGTELRVDSLPAMERIYPTLCGLPSDEVDAYPPSPELVRLDDISMFIHSSGSTGPPKSINYTHRRLLQYMTRKVIGNGPGVRWAVMGLPTFHSMGMLVQVCHSLSTGESVAVYPPQYPEPPVVPHAQNFFEAAKATRCNAILAPPSFIETWSRTEDIIQYLTTLKVMTYAGGPLPLSIGDELVRAGVPLLNGYGGTEFGTPCLSWDKIPRPSPQPDLDWYWYRFAESDTNLHFESQGDGTYELVVEETDDYHVSAHNVTGKRAYATSDLFEPHPHKRGFWKIVGRKDDVIALSIGEKIVPISQETIISADTRVAGCVMFGRQRAQPGILVEPPPEDVIEPTDEAGLIRYRNKIWPAVEKANQTAPAFAKIFKEMIIVTDPGRPLPRVPKGTISRKQALTQYAEKIDRLYEAVAESTNAKDLPLPTTWRVECLEPWLLDLTMLLLGQDKPMSLDDDLFQQGFDSLSATMLRNRIIGALRASAEPTVRRAAQSVPTSLVFEHPTIIQLAHAIEAVVHPPDCTRNQLHPRVAQIEAMVTKYTSQMASPKHPATSIVGPPVVLLTGTTGNIGSHILASLLANSRIGKIYTLDRPSPDTTGRLSAAFADRNLPVGLLQDKRLVALTGAVTHDAFGLDDCVYSELLSTVTHIVHNAWAVNFNLSLQSFEEQIAGVRKLVDIVASMGRPARLLVTSSISVADGWNPRNGPVPEQPLSDPATAASSGYGSSKYVVEQILASARARGLAATSVRMGQACGSKTTGAWGTSEWMPITVKSSLAMGCLPAIRGSVAWLPLDAAGEAYVDWILSPDVPPPLVNVVHPRPTAWDTVIQGIHEELGNRVALVPLRDWVTKLEERATNPSTQDLVDIPALKLLDFFRGLVHSEASDVGAMNVAFESSELLRSSQTMRHLQPIYKDYAKAWVRYWRSRGFITQ